MLHLLLYWCSHRKQRGLFGDGSKVRRYMGNDYHGGLDRSIPSISRLCHDARLFDVVARTRGAKTWNSHMDDGD